MPHTVAIIAPMTDLEEQYHMNLVLKLRKSKRELTLSTLQELAKNGFRTDLIKPGHTREESIPAAGFYLSGLLRAQGYETILTDKCTDDALALIAQKDPIAVCLSTTMVLSSGSLRNLVLNIRKHMPETCIITGGVFVWKSFQAFQATEKNQRMEAEQTDLLFEQNSLDIDTDLYVVAPHGSNSLLMIIKELEKGNKADFEHIPNLSVPHDNGFSFTKTVPEKVDYDQDITRWDLLDELPGQIPVRTSIGCPFRCRYCDFYQLFPKIFLRSKESMIREFKLIQQKLAGRQAIIHATDDNVFINSRRIQNVTEAFKESGIQRWIGFMRASSIKKTNIDLIRDSGLLMSIIGVESGDQDQLDRMNKAQKLPDVKHGMELLDNNGITVMMTYIIGFPGETAETIKNTAGFINDLNIGLASSSYQVYPLVISPFSDLATARYQEKWNISGTLKSWKHYTMDYNEAVRSGYDLFRQVTNVPYHYSQERTFFNREAFTNDQRAALFRLRHQLTIDFLDHSTEKEIQMILVKISNSFGIRSDLNGIDFAKEIILAG